MSVTIDGGPNPYEDYDAYVKAMDAQADAILAACPDADEPEPVEKFDPDQPRDESGKWTDAGGGGGYVPASKIEHQIAATYKDWNLTADEKQALQAYSGSGYAIINGSLRGKVQGLDLAVHAAVVGLDKAIAKSPGLAQPTTVWRWINYPETVLPEWKPGAVLHEKGYTSTTMDDVLALGMKSGGSTMLTIDLPKGTKAAYPLGAGADMGASRVERELILARGSQFRIDSYDPNTREAHLTYLPPD